MSLTARIARNTLYQVLGKIVSIATAVVGVGMVTRYLGQAGFGMYTEAIVFAQFFGTLADFGLYIVTVKRIAEAGDDEPRVFANILTLRFFSALFFVGLAPLVVLLFPYPTVVKWGVLITTLSTLFVSMSQIMNGLFQKHLRMAWSAQAEIVGRIASLALIVALVLGHAPFLWLLFGFVTSNALQFFVLFLYARKILPIRFRIDRDLWRSVLLESWPVAVTIGLNLIYFRADTIILSLYHSASTVGLYGASYKVLEVLVSFPAMFAGLVLPLLTQHRAAGDDDRFRATLQRSFDFLAIVALPVVASIFVLAHPIMTLVSGEEFLFSGSILRVLIFAAGVIFFGNLFGNTIVALGRQKTMMKYYAAVATFALLGYFVLIPRFSVWGASGMTVATELAITLSSFFVVWRTTRIRLSFVQFRRGLLAALAMVAVLFLLRPVNLFAALAGGGLMYAFALLTLGGIRKQEIREMLGRQSP